MSATKRAKGAVPLTQVRTHLSPELVRRIDEEKERTKRSRAAEIEVLCVEALEARDEARRQKEGQGR
jgi:hypothetical protein